LRKFWVKPRNMIKWMGQKNFFQFHNVPCKKGGLKNSGWKDSRMMPLPRLLNKNTSADLSGCRFVLVPKCLTQVPIFPGAEVSSIRTYRKSYFHQVLNSLLRYSLRSKYIHIGTKVSLRILIYKIIWLRYEVIKPNAFSFTSKQIKWGFLSFYLSLIRTASLRVLFYSCHS
jgi:hypothetical protein